MRERNEKDKLKSYIDQDVQLMLEFQDGSKSCFEQLVERHKYRVFNLAYRLLGNYQEAEDITQEIFIKIYNAKDTYKPRAKFTTWLYVICKNTCLKELRKKGPPWVFINSSKDSQEDMVSFQIADPHTPSPSDSLLDSERTKIVKEAIDSLPTNQRMAVVLYRYDQLSYEEISEIMDCTVEAVKSLLHRARINLKERLANYFKTDK